MNKYKALLFDLDGTLWSTIESCMESIKYVRNKHKEITREKSKLPEVATIMNGEVMLASNTIDKLFDKEIEEESN